MLFVVRFTDHADRLPIRQKFFPVHKEFLDRHRDRILVPGALREQPDGNPVGALWIAEAESKAALEALLKTDPFWTEGLRKSYEILHWGKAFPERKTPV